MFQQPQHSNTLPRFAQAIIAVLIAMSLLSASRAALKDIRCGAACQRAVTGQEF